MISFLVADIIVVDPDKTLLQGRPEPNEPEAEPKSGPENIPPTDPSQESAEGEDFNNRINNMPGGAYIMTGSASFSGFHGDGFHGDRDGFHGHGFRGDDIFIIFCRNISTKN